MKHLSIDLGEKRIGLAVSDEKGIIANPLSIIKRTSDKESLEEIASICLDLHIEKIVLGIPYSSNNDIQERFRSFGKKLAAKSKLSIREWDETFSTKQAQNMVAFADSPMGKPPSGKLSTKKQKKTQTHRDDVAAAIILQEYLDHEKRR